MKKYVSTILMVLVLIAGVAMLLYPTFSERWNLRRQSMAISTYEDAMEGLDTAVYEKAMQDAVVYNERLPFKPNRWELTDEEIEEYESLLSVTDSGVMGYVEIPCIDSKLAIYHGTNEETLQIGVGHIEGTSLPIGGTGTHTVLSGHRGLMSAKLFTDLDQMSVGDVFLLEILGHTMTYKVDQIRIVLPSELEELRIDAKEDYCTLLTCTPYGINSHRLLVRGTRIPNEAAAAAFTKDAKQVSTKLVAAGLTGIILLIWTLAKGVFGIILRRTRLYK